MSEFEEVLFGDASRARTRLRGSVPKPALFGRGSGSSAQSAVIALNLEVNLHVANHETDYLRLRVTTKKHGLVTNGLYARLWVILRCAQHYN